MRASRTTSRTTAGALGLALCALAWSACRDPKAGREGTHQTDAAVPAPIASAASPSGTTARVMRRADIELLGARVDAVPGDFVLRSRGLIAVISVDGRLVDFARAGTADGLSFLDPQLALGHSLVPTRTESVSIVDDVDTGSRALYVRRVGEGATLHAHWYFDGARLALRTRVERAAEDRRPLRAALRLGWGNVPTFLPGAPDRPREDEVYAVPFLARLQQLLPCCSVRVSVCVENR